MCRQVCNRSSEHAKLPHIQEQLCGHIDRQLSEHKYFCEL